jgi:hypothetical protein
VKRRKCLHDSDARRCPRCAAARWRLLLAYAQLAKLVNPLVWSGHDVDRDALRKRLSTVARAVGGFKACIRPAWVLGLEARAAAEEPGGTP